MSESRAWCNEAPIEASTVCGALRYLQSVSSQATTRDKVYHQRFMLVSQPSIMVRPWMTLGERLCCAAALLFPKVFFSALIAWCHYVFLVRALDDSTSGWVLGILGSTLCFLSVLTYYQVIWVGPGSPLDFPELHIEDLDALTRPPPTSSSAEPSVVVPPDFVSMYTVRQRPRAPLAFKYCLKCSCWKPDRCHHCLSCQRCVLRMDHHCPWFATCIGFRNQKFFVQFLAYLALYSGVVFGRTLWLLWGFFTDERYADGEFLLLQILFLFVISVTFGVAITAFTAYSFYLVVANKTTIEIEESKWQGSRKKGQYEFATSGLQAALQPNIFDLGSRRNWQAVMGRLWVQWVLPVAVASKRVQDEGRNGLSFDVDHEAYDQWCRDLELQARLNDRMEEYVRIRDQQEGRVHK